MDGLCYDSASDENDVEDHESASDESNVAGGLVDEISDDVYMDEDEDERLPRPSDTSGRMDASRAYLQEGYVPPKASALQLLEQGKVFAAEGLAYSHYMERGMQLEQERVEAKRSFESARSFRGCGSED